MLRALLALAALSALPTTAAAGEGDGEGDCTMCVALVRALDRRNDAGLSARHEDCELACTDIYSSRADLREREPETDDDLESLVQQASASSSRSAAVGKIGLREVANDLWGRFGQPKPADLACPQHAWWPGASLLYGRPYADWPHRPRCAAVQARLHAPRALLRTLREGCVGGCSAAEACAAMAPPDMPAAACEEAVQAYFRAQRARLASAAPCHPLDVMCARGAELWLRRGHLAEAACVQQPCDARRLCSEALRTDCSGVLPPDDWKPLRAKRNRRAEPGDSKDEHGPQDDGDHLPPWYELSERPASPDEAAAVAADVFNGRVWLLDRRGRVFEEQYPERLNYWLLWSYQLPFLHVANRLLDLPALTARVGLAYDDTNSTAVAAKIRSFVAAYGIDVRAVRGWRPEAPGLGFPTFNAFFARRLRPGLRPVAAAPDAVVSPADCRMLVFPSVDSREWRAYVKGEAFSLPAVLGGDERLAARLAGGPAVIARLAPQDYHRFHLPVDARVGPSVAVGGSYWSVNPFAASSPYYDVYADNKRVVTELHSERAGAVGYVAVGATLVGSVVISSAEGASLRRGDEHGWFEYGGSTVLLFFEPGAVELDADLVANSARELETLVAMGTSIGRVCGEGGCSWSSSGGSSFGAAADAEL